MLLLLLLCSSAMAKIIYVDDDAAGANNGSSWIDAYNYLQDALVDANTAEKPVEIRVAQGVYKPDQGAGITRGNKGAAFQLINGVAVLGGFAGVGATEPDARDIETYETILSGDLAGDDAEIYDPEEFSGHPTRAENSDTVVRGNNTDQTAVLDGVTITAGSQCMRNWSCNPTVENCTFTNASTGIDNRNGSQTLTGCTFKGLWSEVIQSGGSLTVISCIFIGNMGVVIDCTSRGELTLRNCTFIDNNVRVWSMIHCAFQENLRMYGCEFKNNISSALAVVWAHVNQEFVAENCVFSGNVGDLISTRGENVVISNCIFTGSIGDVVEHHGNQLVVSNCVFAGNMGDRRSGGVYSNNECTKIQNCTFSDNSSEGDGSALNFKYGGKVSNCIFWSNNLPAIGNRYGEIVIHYCNVEGGWPGEGNIDVDPYFASPGYWDQNGTPDDTSDDFWVDGDYHLKSQAGRWDPVGESWVIDDVTSPCIDAGDPLTPVMYEPHPRGYFINMGAYGGTEKASKSPLN
jgi:hypothetical protein